MIITGKQRRYLNTGSNQSSATLAAGRVASIGAEYESATNYRLIPIQSDGGTRTRGVILGFMGVGDDNGTFNYRVWIARKGETITRDGNRDIKTDYDLQYFGGGAATLSTALGTSSNSVVRDTERIADTVTWTRGTSATTPKGVGVSVEATFGAGIASAAYSPADNTPGYLYIPDVGSADALLVEFNTPLNVTRMNCYYEMVS